MKYRTGLALTAALACVLGAPALAGVTDPGTGAVYGGADLRPASGTITAADVGTGTVAGQSGVTLVTGTPTAGSFQTWALNAHSSSTITVTGTFSATLQIELSADGGVTYGPATTKILGSSSTTSTVTAPGVFRVDVTGMTNVRVRATAYVSGTATVMMAASTAPGLSQILNPITATLSGSTSNNTDAQAPTATNAPAVTYLYGWNGTGWDRLQVDGSKNLKMTGAFTGTVTASPPAATPAAGNTSVVTVGGTAVIAVTGPVNGCYITNPVSATDEAIGTAENIYVNPVTTATTLGNGSNLTRQPGETFYCVPGQQTSVSVNAATSAHAITVVKW